MPTSQDLAAAFIVWAYEEHLLSYTPRLMDETVNAEEQLAERREAAPSMIRSEFAPHELDAVRNAFQSNRIHYVGYADKRIVIAAPSRITGNIKLPTSTRGGIWLDFQSWKAPDILPARNSVGPATTKAMIGSRYPCGTSISTGDEISAGTFGCLVRDGKGRLFGLSNNHVVGQCNDAEKKLPIVAPGLLDVQAGALDPFTLGHFHDLTQLTHGLPQNVVHPSQSRCGDLRDLPR